MCLHDCLHSGPVKLRHGQNIEVVDMSHQLLIGLLITASVTMPPVH